MEMLCSFQGDKHEFYLVIQFKHVGSCPYFGITYT